MSLDLPSLVPQIDAAGAAIAQELGDLAARLPRAVEALRAASEIDPDALQVRLARAGDRWPGAIPTGDSLARTFPPPNLDTPLHILGADGSQIPPDRHAAALYYLINIGSLRYTAGSGEAPIARSAPSLHAGREELYLGDGRVIGTEIVHARRDVAEMAELARLAEGCQPDPSLALLDNGLILWIALQEQGQPRQEVDRLLQAYLDQLDRVRSAGAALAGIIDRPRHANVLTLLHLLNLPVDSVNADQLQASPYLGLTDRSLFARVLDEGERSAVFEYASIDARFQKAGHTLAFFYFRPIGSSEPMRVEIPMWVADSVDLMERVHAGLIEQGRTTGGFPYVLARAHELAVVSRAERQAVDGLFEGTLLRRGVHRERSSKQTAKDWLGGRRRHRV
jgi:hypothetical protein